MGMGARLRQSRAGASTSFLSAVAPSAARPGDPGGSRLDPGSSGAITGGSGSSIGGSSCVPVISRVPRPWVRNVHAQRIRTTIRLEKPIR